MRADDFQSQGAGRQQRRLRLRLQRLRAVLAHNQTDEKRRAAKGAFRCNGRLTLNNHFKAGAADTVNRARRASGGVIMQMDLKNNIKVIGSFQKTVNALYIIINVLRALAVAFLVLQTVILLFNEKAR